MAKADLAKKRRTIPGIQMLLFSITEGVDGLAGSFGGKSTSRTFLADLELGSETATDVLAIDDDFRSSFAKEATDLVGDDEGALGGCVHDRILTIRFDHQTVRLERGVRLDRCGVTGFERKIGSVDRLGGLFGRIPDRCSSLFIVKDSGLAVQTGPLRIQRLEAALQPASVPGHEVSDGVTVVFAGVSGYHDLDNARGGERGIAIE